MNKKLLRMAKPQDVLRLAKWLNKVDDAKLDLLVPKDNDDSVAVKKIHNEMADRIWLHLLYQ